MIGLVRGMIADPMFAAKAEAGRVDDIRSCIACNQACFGHRLQYHPVSCIQHPETGRASSRSATSNRRPRRHRTVWVVGGGPGGHEGRGSGGRARSRRDALRTDPAGSAGRSLLAQALPGRAEFGGIVTNLVREMELAGVRIERGVAVTAAAIRDAGPDATVVATGGQPYLPMVEGEDEAHVVESWSVIRGEANVGRSVLVADWKNDWIGLGLAEKLARDGCRVRLAVTGMVPGQNIQEAVRDHWIGQLSRLGVEIITYARLFGADRDTIYLQHTVTDDPIVCDDVETLVLCQGTASDTALAGELAGWPGEVHVIGDALSPRTAEEAVLDGLRAGMAIGA